MKTNKILIMLGAALIPVMGFLSRLSGGGFFAPKIWSRLPELIFALNFGVCAGATQFFISGDISWLTYLVGFIGWQASYWAMEMGHGTFYMMKGWASSNPNRIQTIEKLVRVFYKGDIKTPLYSWICMGFKGFLIGLAAFPFGLLLTFLWPAAYYMGAKENGHVFTEFCAGVFAGLVIFCNIIFWSNF